MISTDMILLSESVTGASHLLTGKECQDSNLSWRSPAGDIAIIAVSDGHGGEKYCNSSLGSALGCEVAIEVLREFCQVKSSAVADSDMRHLAQCFVAQWRSRVIAIDENVESFGCTLIACAQTPHYSFALQLGDGLLSILNSEGEWQQPMPTDSRCFLNETTSMCDLTAADEFRWVTFNTDNAPCVAILSTDGIDNTFCDDDLLHNFYNRILDSIAEESPEKVKRQMPEVLSHYSKIGSKDDMTLSILINNKPTEYYVCINQELT